MDEAVINIFRPIPIDKLPRRLNRQNPSDVTPGTESAYGHSKLNECVLLNERVCFRKSIFFSLRVDPIEIKTKKFIFPESVPILSKLSLTSGY